MAYFINLAADSISENLLQFKKNNTDGVFIKAANLEQMIFQLDDVFGHKFQFMDLKDIDLTNLSPFQKHFSFLFSTDTHYISVMQCSRKGVFFQNFPT